MQLGPPPSMWGAQYAVVLFVYILAVISDGKNFWWQSVLFVLARGVDSNQRPWWTGYLVKLSNKVTLSKIW